MQQIARRKAATKFAGLHIAIAGELQSQSEARALFAQGWGNTRTHKITARFVTDMTEPGEWPDVDINIDLYGMGQSPDWRDRFIAALEMPLDMSVMLDAFFRDP